MVCGGVIGDETGMGKTTLCLKLLEVMIIARGAPLARFVNSVDRKTAAERMYYYFSNSDHSHIALAMNTISSI